jgi:hypothetical protein
MHRTSPFLSLQKHKYTMWQPEQQQVCIRLGLDSPTGTPLPEITHCRNGQSVCWQCRSSANSEQTIRRTEWIGWSVFRKWEGISGMRRVFALSFSSHSIHTIQVKKKDGSLITRDLIGNMPQFVTLAPGCMQPSPSLPSLQHNSTGEVQLAVHSSDRVWKLSLSWDRSWESWHWTVCAVNFYVHHKDHKWFIIGLDTQQA